MSAPPRSEKSSCGCDKARDGGAAQAGLWAETAKWGAIAGAGPGQSVPLFSPGSGEDPLPDQLPDLPPWDLAFHVEYLPHRGDTAPTRLSTLLPFRRLVFDLTINTAATMAVVVTRKGQVVGLDVVWSVGPLNNSGGEVGVYTPNEENELAYVIDLTQYVAQNNCLPSNFETAEVTAACLVPTGGQPYNGGVLLFHTATLVEAGVASMSYMLSGFTSGQAAFDAYGLVPVAGVVPKTCLNDEPSCYSLRLHKFRIQIFAEGFK